MTLPAPQSTAPRPPAPQPPADTPTGLQRFEVEFIAHVYVRVPVLCHSVEEAQDAADSALPRCPVVATRADGCPGDASVTVSKTWEFNSVTGPDGETTWS